MSDNRFQQLKARTYTDILTAGFQLILEKGYDAVTITEIAQRADYGRSTFYLHFRDKEDLVWALLKTSMVQMDRQIAESIQHLESPAREWASWLAIFRSVDVSRPFYLQMDGELSRRLRQWQKEHLITTLEQQFRRGVYSLLIDIPPEIGARFVVGALLELLDFWLHHPEYSSADEMAGYMFRLVFRRDPPQIDPPPLPMLAQQESD